MIKLYQLCRTGLVCLALLFTSISLFSQSKRTLTAYPNTVVDTYIHGFYASLPANYSTSGKKYPLLVFMHGMGEIGDGSAANLAKVLRNGPPMQINQQVNNNVNANFPDPVVVNGKSYEFIVICPQMNGWPVIGPAEVAMNNMINYAISHYRVDTSKMYLTGLSMGGGLTWEYAGLSGPLYAKRLAGLLPVAGASYPVKERAAEIAKEHLPVWATANSSDPQVPTSYTTGYIDLLNKAGANPAPLMTIFPEQNQHGGWLKTYGAPNQPGVVQNGLNVYQWMLQYKRQGDNVVIDNGGTSVFTVNAGPDLTIGLPANSVKITGAFTVTSGETVASCKWTQVSGPSTAAISGGGSISPTFSQLVQGAYTFQVTLTSKSGKSTSDQVKITVNAASTVTFTVSAGPDVYINLPTNSWKIAGVATVKGVSVASCKWLQISGPSAAGISGTGSISPTVSKLVAGTYTFEVDITSTTGLVAKDQMNVNVNVVKPAGAASETNDATGLNLDGTDPDPTLRLYPNPVTAGQQFAVEGRGVKAGTVKFMIYDISGRLVKQLVLENQSDYFRQTIPAAGLVRGSYMLAVTIAGDKPRTFKLLVQ